MGQRALPAILDRMHFENPVTPALIGLNADTIFRRTMCLIATLTAGHIIYTYLYRHAGYVRGIGLLSVLNLEAENSFGTWVASLLLLAIAVGLMWIAQSAASEKREWWGLGILVLAMSCDEVSGIHERLVVLREIAKSQGIQLPPMFYFAWTIPALIGVVVIAILYARFLFRLPRAHAPRLFAAAGCYFGGAVGIEMLSGSVLVQYGAEGALYAWYTLAEEVVELLGLALGLRAVLLLLGDLNAAAALRVHKADGYSPA